jgi:hypothetical protein
MFDFDIMSRKEKPMRKFFAAAAGLSATAMLIAAPASADIQANVCFSILDQLQIDDGGAAGVPVPTIFEGDGNPDNCVLEVEAYLIDSLQGPYTVSFEADGNLLCTALEGKYLASYAPIAGVVEFDPFAPAFPMPLREIKGDDPLCTQ